MSISEVKTRLDELYKDIVSSDYNKENFPLEIEDIVDKLRDCLELLD